MAESSNCIAFIKGIDNTSDPLTLQINRNDAVYVREAINVDIDDKNKPHRRDGSSIINSGIYHSLWSNEKICLFVKGTELRKLNTDLTETVLITDINPDDRMSYVSVNDIVYFSSNSIIGYIRDNLPYPFPEPNQTFKTKMIGGQLIEFYNNRLYAANDCNLFFSDATVLTRMDMRKNAIAFSGRITMVKSVIDGIYISANNKTYFMSGSDPFKFTLIPILDVEAIENTSISLESDHIGRGVMGKTVYFLTPNGPYKGYPGGAITELQDGVFEINNVERGISIIKDDHGYKQFLSICQLRAGIGATSGSISLPIPEITN